MSIGATEAVAPTSVFATTAAPAAGSGQDQDMFLQLLVAQMKYQDPMNPADSSEFLSQNAQFTALEKMQEVADKTSLLLDVTMAFGATGMVGRTISYTDAGGATRTGAVSGVTFGAGGPMLDVDGASVPMSSVQQVTAGPAAAAAAAPMSSPVTSPVTGSATGTAAQATAVAAGPATAPVAAPAGTVVL